ncbi:MAG: hypothetical protein WD468_02370 [Pirellulales bacterium]
MLRAYRALFFVVIAIGNIPCSTVVAQVENPFDASSKERAVQIQNNPVRQAIEPSPAPTDPPAAEGEKSLLAEPVAVPPVDPFSGKDETPVVFAPTAAAPQEFCRCVDANSSAPAVARIQEVLRSPLKEGGMEFTDNALQEVVSFLQEEYGIPIKLDTGALDNLGVSPDQPVTVSLHGISLIAALRLMLEELNLTYIIQNEVLMITTCDEAAQQLKICVYDVRDLVDPSKPAEMDALRDTIATCVASETWAVNGGGEAEIRPLRQSLLVISQTLAVHDEIRALLDTIRKQLHAHHHHHAGAEDQPAIPEAAKVEDAEVVTRSYYLQINQQPSGEAFAPQIRELITQALPDVQWAGRLENGEPVVLTVLPDRIVLRHRQSVQEKVESLLSDSGIASPPAAVAEGGGRGFGGGGGGGGGFFNPRSPEKQ